jgi:hypothetical protein
MPEVQNPDRKSSDPRWITLRVSRINLGISLLGALLAFPVMLLVSGMPPWIRIALLAGFTLSMAWDLRLILLKGRHSVGAFHLLDLDPAVSSSPSGAKPGKRDTGKDLPRLGIRLRLANAAKHRVAAELDGVVLAGSFVSPWFTALRYRLPDDAAWRRGWPRVIPLWPDSLEAGEFRKIRVALKWK